MPARYRMAGLALIADPAKLRHFATQP